MAGVSVSEDIHTPMKLGQVASVYLALFPQIKLRIDMWSTMDFCDPHP